MLRADRRDPRWFSGSCFLWIGMPYGIVAVELVGVGHDVQGFEDLTAGGDFPRGPRGGRSTAPWSRRRWAFAFRASVQNEAATCLGFSVRWEVWWKVTK